MSDLFNQKTIFGGNSSTIQDLNITNNLDVGNTITAVTVTATNGNFTNLTGTVLPGQLLVKRNETTRDNASIISGNSSATLANNSNGIHVGYNTTNQVGSIYCMNNSNVITDLYLNNTSTLGLGTVHAGELRTDNFAEETTNNGISVNSGMKLRAAGLRHPSSNLDLDSTGSYVDLKCADTSVLRVASTLITANQAVTLTLGGTVTAGQQLTLGAGGSLIKDTQLKLLGTLTSGIYVSTTDPGLNWIAMSAGIEGVGVGRVVLGNLNGYATIGGHSYTGGLATGWADLNISDGASANTHINPTTYTSANRLSCAGYIDTQTGYKINNSCLIEYAGGSTVNTFNFPNKSAGSYTLATTVDIPTVTNKQTMYLASNGTLVNAWFLGPMGMNATEDNLRWLINRTGNLSNMRVMLVGAPGAGVTFTFTVKIDKVNTALTVSIIDANLTGSNLGTSVAISGGQTWSVSFATTGGAPTSYAYVSFDHTA